MELTINITEESKFDFFLKLLKELSFVEIVNVNENDTQIPYEHKVLLEQRLKRIESGETNFKSWDSIKMKYEKK